MSFLGVVAKPGEITRTRVPIGELPDGSPIAIPVVVIRGIGSGPTLYLQAGLHGDELTGVEICRRAIGGIDPKLLSGTVVAVPLANVPAYLTRTRGYLHEERWLIDVNRIFPGNPRGLLSERIANMLLGEFIMHADFSIDLHSALDGCDMAPHVYVDPADGETVALDVRERAALAFGTPFVFYRPRGSKTGTSDMSRSLGAQADAARKSVMMADLGESRRVSSALVPMAVRGIHNTLRVLGMEKGEPVREGRARKFSRFSIVHVERGGGLRLAVELGDEVRAGGVVGEIVDVFGQTVETLLAPVDGFVLRVMRFGSVATGAEAVWIGQ